MRKIYKKRKFGGAHLRYILSLTRLKRDCVRLGLRVTGHWACKTHPGQQTVLASLATHKLDSTSIVSPFHHHPPQPFTLLIVFSCLNFLEPSLNCQIFYYIIYYIIYREPVNNYIARDIYTCPWYIPEYTYILDLYILKSRQKCRDLKHSFFKYYAV